MRAALAFLVCIPLASLVSAQVSPVGPFTGTHSEDFNDQNNPSSFDTCLPDRVFDDLADLCTFGDDPDPSLAFTLGQACSMQPFEGAKQYWSNCPNEIIFDKPPARFGGYFATVSGTANGTARFYDTGDNLVSTQTITYPGLCTWTWNGWSFAGPIGRIELEGGFYLIKGDPYYTMSIDSMEVDFAGPCLATSGMIASQNGTVAVSNATPFGQVGVAYSVAGPGPTSIPVPGCGTVSAALTNPKLAGLGFADANGTFTLNPPVPPSATGIQIWVHAVDETSCSTTNPRAITFQ